jgi:RNA polymerase sigma factor (TIGR02999 family)
VSSSDSLAALVARAETGDPAAKDALFATLYNELHRLARSHLHRSPGSLTLGATTLLHETYLNIASRDELAFPDRARFLAYASRAMRGLVIDYLRTRNARKRGGGVTFTTLDEAQAQPAAEEHADLLALSAALDQLATLDPPLAELVDLKFFCGFSFADIAALRRVSERTVQRDWAKARLILHTHLQAGDTALIED